MKITIHNEIINEFIIEGEIEELKEIISFLGKNDVLTKRPTIER